MQEIFQRGKILSTASEAVSRRGRPRSDEAHQAILKAALEEVFAVGFRALGIDVIAAKAGVGKATIYRRWPNKAAVVMDAFLAEVGPGTGFPRAPRAVDRIRMQMEAQSKAFRSKYGVLIKSLLGEAQFDPELAEAFRERWIMPRRRMAREVLEEAIQQGDLREDIDFDAAIDMLYAPIYYRLQIGTGPISEQYVRGIFEQVMSGLGRKEKTATARLKR
ncbi:transcriptional regulator, TetR family [Terriglobus roseus]|uniref:Transcriptional regulator, TetR family n=1 Tax=Terriglobus roseus TaxID=392734 RepID=A0A1G7EQM3_9BACT|nr:transcriptional regulator, TetR family [Terriglobus roseus]